MICHSLDDENEHHGWIETNKGLAPFSVTTKNGFVDVHTLCVSDDIMMLLQDLTTKKWFLEKFHNLGSSQFAQMLQGIVNNVEPKQATTSSNALPVLLVSEISEIGWSAVRTISEDFSTIALVYKDHGHRYHEYDIHISPSYPAEVPKIHACVPVPIVCDWRAGSSLKDVHTTVGTVIEQFAPYFEVLVDFSEHTWILEPSFSSGVSIFSSSTRRLVVDRIVSVIIVVNPRVPRGIPVEPIRFLGPYHRCGPLEAKLAADMWKWKDDLLPRENVETILDIKFPLPLNASSSGPGGPDNVALEECCICYSYLAENPDSLARVQDDVRGITPIGGQEIFTHSHSGGIKNGLTPEELCPNQKCNRAFHRSCLLAVFLSKSNTKHSLGTVFGSCPFCDSSISIVRKVR